MLPTSTKGGPGSGNFGHSGIPGQQGGSGPGGGSEQPRDLQDRFTAKEVEAVTEQQSALYSSTIGGYSVVNNYLRSGELYPNADENKIKEHITHLDAALKKSPTATDMVVFRGIRTFDKNLKVGETYTDKGYISTSVSREATNQFREKLNRSDSPVLLEIHVPKGYPSIDVTSVTGKRAGLSKPEREILLPRNTTFKVTSFKNNKYVLTIEGNDKKSRIFTEWEKEGAGKKALKAKSNFYAWVWNPYQRRYQSVTGEKIDTDKLRDIVDDLRKGTQERLAVAAKELQSGEQTNLAEFALNFKDEIKNLYTATHVLARGGVEEMDQSDWGELGASLKEQYGYIDSLVRDIDNGLIGERDEFGDVIIRDSGIPELTDGFIDRVDMYTESAWGGAGEFEDVVRSREQDLGSLERRVLGDSKQSCQDCIEAAAQGWQPAGILPDIGDTECGPGCNCTFEFENEELDALAQTFGAAVEPDEPNEE